MSPKPKNPTNGDIYRKLDSMDGRLASIEKWRDNVEAGKAAVDEYKKDEQTAIRAKQMSQLVKDILPLIVGLTVLAYALAGHFGGK